MRLEDQVVSLGLAKELKEAGYVQEGLWWWSRINKDWHLVENSILERIVPDIDEAPHTYKEEGLYREDILVAPTVSELGAALPICMIVDGAECNLEIHKVFPDDECEYVGWIVRYYDKTFTGTLVNAMASMWLYLKRKGLLNGQE